MKNKMGIILVLMGFVLAGTLNAQNNVVRNIETASISGKLALDDNGVIVVQNEDQSCYAVGFHYLIGFVDGLKEGSDVTLEGYWLPVAVGSEQQYFMVSALTFNGKRYQLRVPYTNLGGWRMNQGLRFHRDMNYWQHHRGMRYDRNSRPWQNNNNDRQNNRGRNNYQQNNNRGRW